MERPTERSHLPVKQGDGRPNLACPALFEPRTLTNIDADFAQAKSSAINGVRMTLTKSSVSKDLTMLQRLSSNLSRGRTESLFHRTVIYNAYERSVPNTTSL